MNKLPLIPAATVLVLRDTKDGIEVLMVKRSKRPPFENLFVFPGGKIDEPELPPIHSNPAVVPSSKKD